MTNFGHNMAAARQRAGYSQRQAADALGISQGYLGGMEIGRNNPDVLHLLVKMAKLYRATPNDLLGVVGAGETDDILIRLSPQRYKEVMEIARLFLLLDSQEYRSEVMQNLIASSDLFDGGRVAALLQATISQSNSDVGDAGVLDSLGLADQF